MVWWLDEIAKRTNNRVKVQIFWGGSLAGINDILDAVKAGTAEMGMVTHASFMDKLPLANLSDGVIMKPDLDILLEAAYKLWDEYPQFEQELNQWNQKMLAPSGLSSYQLVSTKPVRSLEDFKGLKVRVWGKYVPKWWQAVGAVGSTTLGGETYDALAKGVLNAAPISYELIESYKWYEVAKYLTEIYMGSVWGYTSTINLDVWKSLPSDVQKIVLDTGREFCQLHAKLTDESIEKIKKRVKDTGVEIIPFPESDRAKWKNMDAVKGTVEDWINIAEGKGYPGRKMMTRFLELIKY